MRNLAQSNGFGMSSLIPVKCSSGVMGAVWNLFYDKVTGSIQYKIADWIFKDAIVFNHQSNVSPRLYNRFWELGGTRIGF